MNLEFDGKIWYWRGPSPYYFVTVPAEQSDNLKVISGIVTYGWGMIPDRQDGVEDFLVAQRWPLHRTPQR